MLHLQEKFVQRRTLTPEPLNASLEPINYRGFAPRLPAVTREELEEASRLFVLAEQQRRIGGVL